MKNIPQIRKKGKSKRSRCRGRTTDTFNNKLSKLQSQYNHLFKTSQKSKEIFNRLKEETKEKVLKSLNQKREDSKPFFCDKYSNFNKFLAVNKLRQIGNQETAHKTYNKKEDKKKQVYGGR